MYVMRVRLIKRNTFIFLYYRLLRIIIWLF